ncbi:MAG: hypothetical protein JNK20_02745 [Flavipsychrobacter sp.]|jgi:Xaa-Pro aminopeptidase|nr:hypothetical protein [Flavipsychrobacter sp.]
MAATEVYLKKMEWPLFGEGNPVIFPPVSELEERISLCRAYMHNRGFTHLLIYGDREHFANLLYLVHFDPRFEEALLILGLEGDPLLLVGNECVSHLTVSPLYQAGRLRYERYQPFSLISQPRNSSRPLAAIFAEEGMVKGAKVGCVGWKYFSYIEFSQPEKMLDIPGFIADTVRNNCGYDAVENGTDIFMSPVYGLKATCSAFEIAQFEFSNTMASEGMIHFFKNFKVGATDFEMVQQYKYTGYPLGCHIGLKSDANQHIGLSSPTGGVIRQGDPCSTNLSYWGSNICRAGWVVANEKELPEKAAAYIREFAAPYFRACSEWLKMLRIGAVGGEIYSRIQELLPFEQFNVFLNPGHLIHFEEWVSSPIYEGSLDTIRSGMYFQLDIIPRSKQYFSSRMEDGYVVADEKLQQELKNMYPDCYDRCMARREFMQEELGFLLPKEILPLSNTAGLVPPFFLDYQTVLSFKS